MGAIKNYLKPLIIIFSLQICTTTIYAGDNNYTKWVLSAAASTATAATVYAGYNSNKADQAKALSTKIEEREFKRRNERFLGTENQAKHYKVKEALKSLISTRTKSYKEFPTLKEWVTICEKLPKYKFDEPKPSKQMTKGESIKNACRKAFGSSVKINKHQTFETPLSKELFLDTIDKFIKKQSSNLQNSLWLNNQQPHADFYDNTIAHLYEPFIKKLVLPNNSTCVFHGDLHGDLHSLVAFMSYLAEKKILGGQTGLEVVDKNAKLIFLGDYTDRGWYGAETLALVLHLKNINPENVILIRGNHEEAQANIKYGLHAELIKKFEMELHETQNIYRIYNYLPTAMFLGSESDNKYILCCHGGLEIGYNPKPLLQDKAKNVNHLMGDLLKKTNFDTLPDEAKKLFRTCESATDMKNVYKELKQISVADVTPINSCKGIPLSHNRTTYSNQRALSKRLHSHSETGFMWSDFMVQGEKPFYCPKQTVDKMVIQKLKAISSEHECLVNKKHVERNSRAWEFGLKTTAAILQHLYSCKNESDPQVVMVCRAHQHGDWYMMMSILNADGKNRPTDTGVSKLWQKQAAKSSGKVWKNLVCTFNLSPGSEQSMQMSDNKEKFGFDYDSFGILSLSDKFKSWQLWPIRIKSDGTSMTIDETQKLLNRIQENYENKDSLKTDSTITNIASSSAASSSSNNRNIINS